MTFHQPGCSERVSVQSRPLWTEAGLRPESEVARREREESRHQRQSVSEDGGIGIWQRLVTTGDKWGPWRSSL